MLPRAQQQEEQHAARRSSAWPTSRAPRERLLRSIFRFLSSASIYDSSRLLPQGGQDFLSRRIARREQSADASRAPPRSRFPTSMICGRHLEIERHLGEIGVADCGRDAVQRQHQQAAEQAAESREQAPIPGRSSTECCRARTRARAACRSPARGAPPRRTWCSSRRSCCPTAMMMRHENPDRLDGRAGRGLQVVIFLLGQRVHVRAAGRC